MESQSASPISSPRPRWQRWLLIAAIVVAVLFAAMQLVGAARQVSRVFGHRQDAIAPWMTMGHVARLHHVALSQLESALGFAPGSTGRRPLGAIARQQHETFEVFQAKVQAAINQLGGIEPSSSQQSSGVQPPGSPSKPPGPNP